MRGTVDQLEFERDIASKEQSVDRKKKAGSGRNSEIVDEEHKYTTLKE